MAARPDKPDSTRARARAPRDWKERFLAALADTGVISHACDIAGVNRQYAYEAREHDEAFRLAWAELDERTVEVMEREAYRRAVEGTEKPVYHGGELVGHVQEFSDSLIQFLLKARRPTVYREQHRVEHVGKDGAPLSVNVNLDGKQRKALSDVLRGRPAARGD